MIHGDEDVDYLPRIFIGLIEILIPTVSLDL